MSSSGRSRDRFEDSGFAVPLSTEVEGALSFQSYSGAESIEGVRLDGMRKHRGENGWFAELFRLDAGNLNVADGALVELRQISAAYAEPHRINAFHIHPKQAQDEIWLVLQGGLTVWMVDCRLGSGTESVRQRVQLSGEAPQRLFIPAGVAHGYRAGGSGALLVYAMNQQFDPADPNEGRLPWDHFGADLWEEDRG
ncbi:MAG: dTDP-4-dehydrorhamnose 3,5-epimerase family protein [Gemmatimonadota bacterium]